MLTATVPKGLQCVLRNTATMTLPLANTRFNGSGADDSASAFAKIPSPECNRMPTCERPGDGEFRTGSGACACKEGLGRYKGHCTATIEPTPHAATCPNGKPLPPDGVCPCEAGRTWNRQTNVCEAACEPSPNEYRTSTGQCVCKSGYSRQDGRCVAGTEPERCDPGRNEYLDSRNMCVCKEGYDRIEGRCVPQIKLCMPGPDEYRTASGQCVCKEGFERNGSGVCSRPDRTCGANETRNDAGRCVCMRDYVRDNNGHCVTEIGPDDICKQRGGRWTGGSCVLLTDPAQECKRRGWMWSGDRCVQPPSRADECIKKGGTVRNGDCIMGPTPAELCEKRGGKWKDHECLTTPKRCPDGMTGTPPNCLKTKVDPASCKRGDVREPKTGNCVTPTRPNTQGQTKLKIDPNALKNLQPHLLKQQQN